MNDRRIFGWDLPPGVTPGMLPGNRPEDDEIEIPIVFLYSDIRDLHDFAEREKALPQKDRDDLLWFVEDLLEQIEEELPSDWCD